MKPVLTQIFISICLLANSHAQRIDSIKYSNGHLYFHHYGEGETVIFLNGGLINHYSQLAEMARETGKFFHVILTEQRGTGKSIPIPFDSTTLNMQTAVDDIKLVLENQKLKQVSILGHSWGAMLAIAFASQYPKMVKSLILVVHHCRWQKLFSIFLQPKQMMQVQNLLFHRVPAIPDNHRHCDR